MTTSEPSAAATGQLVPNGPRRPIVAPVSSIAIAPLTAPTSRTVCTNASLFARSPLTLIGHLTNAENIEHIELPGLECRSSSRRAARVRASRYRTVRAASGRRDRVCGRKASGAAAAIAPLSLAISALPIDVEDLKRNLVEALHEDRDESLHHLVAEMMIGLALAAQAGGVDADRPGEFDGAGVEMSSGRGERAMMPRRFRFRRAWKRRSGRAQGQRSRRRPGRGGSGRIRSRLRLRETGIARHRSGGCAHSPPPAGSVRRGSRRRTGAPSGYPQFPSWRSRFAELGVARIAAASSVISMPTGHQVMQRPQPTQPDVPNWSIQFASL